MGVFEIIMLAILMGAATYGGYQQKRQGDLAQKAAESAEDTARKQQQAGYKLLEEENKKRAQAEMAVFARRNVAQERGRPRETILTSPLGAIGQPKTAGKTLLGE